MSENLARGEAKHRKTGLILFAIVLSSIIYGFGMFKLIPLQDAITGYFGIGEAAYGYLNSAANWGMLALSIPLGFLVRQWPGRRSIILGFIIAILGMVLQIVTPIYPLFVVGRAIEGLGTGFTTLAGTSLLLNLVPRDKVGIWSGISILCAVGPQVIVTKGGSMLMISTGMTFQTLFAIIAALYVVAIIIDIICIPGDLKISGNMQEAKPTKEQTLRAIKSPSGWMVNISYVFFSLVSISFTAYVIRYLCMKGFEPAQAANIYSYTTLLGMAAMLVFGIISDKLGTKRKIVIIGYFAGAVALMLLMALPASMIFVYVLVYGTLPRSIAGLTTASATDIAEVPSDVPVVNSVRTQITQIGSVVLSIVLGYMVQYLGYDMSIVILAITMAAGGVCWIFAKRIP